MNDTRTFAGAAAQAADRRRQVLRTVAETGVTSLVLVEPDQLPPVLFLPEVALLLRCSESTITRRIGDGTFPVHPLPSIDRRPRWSRDRLLEWIEQRHRTIRRPRRRPYGPTR